MHFCMTEPNDAPNPDATVPMTGPTPRAASMSRSTGNWPLPGELAKLLPEGNYDVEDFLGQGGMGAVYKATQVRLQRKVAIKIMRRDEGKDYDFEERFRREAFCRWHRSCGCDPQRADDAGDGAQAAAADL